MMTSFPGLSEFLVPAYLPVNASAATIDTLMDAAGEWVYFYGKLFFPARTGSKTLSFAGGGKIHWFCGAKTFADAGTTLRIGTQTPDFTAGPPARGDGGWEVFGDLVGGTDTINATSENIITMQSGSNTLAYGEFFGIKFEMVNRGGSDSVNVRSLSRTAPSGIPGVSGNGGSIVVVAAYPDILIEFDDGTFGTFMGGFWGSPTLSTSATFNSGSSPDEYAQLFKIPFSVQVDALFAYVNLANDAEVILYSDPLGTPNALATVAVDANAISAVGNATFTLTLSSPITLDANTWYAVAFRPTTTTNCQFVYFDVTNNAHMAIFPLGVDSYIGSRTNQTGAFSTTTTRRMLAGVRVCGFDDGKSSAPYIGVGGI